MTPIPGSPATPADPEVWGRDDQFVSLARNVGTRYLVISADAVIGLVLLPFNIAHLGQAAWGLWMLTASLNSYFSVLDLGYGGSITKFVAQYRARRDAAGMNEILSTLFALFAVVGVVAYGIFVLIAFNLTSVFNVPPDQVSTGRSLMLITGLYVSMGFPFSVYGGVMNGFQRYDRNNMVGVSASILVAAVNVVMLSAGFTLVQLVAVTTGIRMAAYLIYRRNAYSVFPALSIGLSRVRFARLREVTGFSIYVSVIDWSNKLNYSIDALVIGAYLSPAAVALWAVPQRLAEFLQRLTNQLNGVLLPVVVDSDAGDKPDRLQRIFVEGTRLSLFGVVPVGAALFMLADPLLHSWVGPNFTASIPITQILVSVIAVRVGCATATTILKGAGEHRMLAFTNAGAALINVVLSLLWIRRFGLLGQAYGTLLPVAGSAIFILWPAACRRVNISAARAFRLAVWPAVWPIAVMVAVVLPLRYARPPSLLYVAAVAALGCLAYAVAFFGLAVHRDERKIYFAKAGQLVRMRRRIPAVA